jgi:hypothetical protein
MLRDSVPAQSMECTGSTMIEKNHLPEFRTDETLDGISSMDG